MAHGFSEHRHGLWCCTVLAWAAVLSSRVAAIELVAAQWRRASADAGGTVEVFVRNDTSRVFRLLGAELLGPGVSSKPAGGTDRAEFARWTPRGAIGSGQVAQIALRVPRVLRLPVELTVRMQTDVGTWEKVFPLRSQVWRITSVTFAEDLSTAYCYVRNTSATEISVRVEEVGGVQLEAEAVGPVLRLLPNQLRCLPMRMTRRPRHGEPVFVRVGVHSSAGRIGDCCALVRANADLLLAFDYGRKYPIPHLTQSPLWAKFGPDVSEETLRGLSGDCRVLELMECANHAHGTKPQAIHKFLDAVARVEGTRPDLLTAMYVCWVGKPFDYYQFGQLPDVMCIEPFLPYEGPPADQATAAWHPFWALAEHAKRAVEPRILYTLVPVAAAEGVPLFGKTGPDGLEVRFMVYCAVAAGSKGILYGYCKGPPTPVMQSSLATLNRELQGIKPYLVVGEPLGPAQANRPQVAGWTLLCGDRGVILIAFQPACMPAGREAQQQEMRRLVLPQVVRDVGFRFSAPDELRLSRVIPVGPVVGSPKLARGSDGTYTLTTTVVRSAEAYLLLPK